METNISSSTPAIQSTSRTQSSEVKTISSRRDVGSATSGFAPRTNVSIGNSVNTMAGILAKVASSSAEATETMPKQLQQLINEVMQSAFSVEASLGEGVGSALESSRFSTEQLTILNRMLEQLAGASANGETGMLSDELGALLTNAKALMDKMDLPNGTILNKLAFQLMNDKGMEELPKELQQLLMQLAGNMQGASSQLQGQNDGMSFLKQLVDAFFPRSMFKGPSNTGTSQQNANMQGQSNTQGQPAMQNMVNGSNANSTGNANNTPLQQNVPSGNNAGAQAQSMPQNNTANGNAQPQNMANTPNNQGQPLPQNGNQGNVQNPMPQGNNNANTSNLTQNNSGQNTANMPNSSNIPNSANTANGTNAGNTTLTNNTGSTNNTGNANNTSNTQNNQGMVPRQEEPGENTLFQRIFNRQSGGMEPGSIAHMLKTKMQQKMSLHQNVFQNNTANLNAMKDMAQMLLRNTTLTMKDAQLLRGFVNGHQGSLNMQDVKQLNLLLRMVQGNVPAALQQAGQQQGMEDLPRLWAFMQLCEMATLKNMKEKDLKSASKQLSTFVNSMKGSMQSQGTFQADGQKSINFMIPLFFGSAEESYPAYVHIYDDNNAKGPDGKKHKETWLRVCVLTDNIGAVEMTCCLFDGQSLSMRVLFSEDNVVKDFKEVLPEIRKSLNNTPVTLTDVRVGTIENPMGFEDGKVDKTR